jgi:DNA polymerase-4
MPDRELEFLHPLPVQALWGVGGKTAAKLHAAGLTTVGEVARVPETLLVEICGRAAGRQLHALSHNRDPRRVRPRVRRRSIGSQHALGRPRRRSPEELDAVLVGLVDRVTRRMRKARRCGRTVVLRVRFGDYTRATRSRTMVRATAQTEPILATARSVLAAAMPLIETRGLTLLGIAVTNLEDNVGIQLALPLGREREAVVDAAVDDVRARFGTAAITRGVLVGRDRGIEVPLLED